MKKSISRLSTAINSLGDRIWRALIWLLYAGILIFAYEQADKWITNGIDEPITKAKIGLLICAALLAMPGLFRRTLEGISPFPKTILKITRTCTVILLLVLGGTTSLDIVVEESRLSPSERAARQQRWDKEQQAKERASELARSRKEEREDFEKFRHVEPTLSQCIERGVKYYKEIGSYPYLSSGERAYDSAADKCSNTRRAFGPWGL